MFLWGNLNGFCFKICNLKETHVTVGCFVVYLPFLACLLYPIGELGEKELQQYKPPAPRPAPVL